MLDRWLALWDKPHIMWSMLDGLLFCIPFLPIIFWPLIRCAFRKKQGRK